MMKSLLVSLVAMSIAGTAMAHGYGRGGYHRPPPPRHHGGGGDFEDGVLAGLLLSTSALFLSDITSDRSYAVYMNADNDAAEYLAVGGEKSPELQAAMNYERNFLAKAQVDQASLNDQQVAYLVMKRAESLR